MDISELTVHKMGKTVPKVAVTEFSDFFTVVINIGNVPEIKFFLYSQQQVVNFKNNFLCAVERPNKAE